MFPKLQRGVGDVIAAVALFVYEEVERVKDGRVNNNFVYGNQLMTCSQSVCLSAGGLKELLAQLTSRRTQSAFVFVKINDTVYSRNTKGNEYFFNLLNVCGASACCSSAAFPVRTSSTQNQSPVGPRLPGRPDSGEKKT